MNNTESQDNRIKLGGFPPIYYLSTENKKKREFKEKIKDSVDIKNIKKLNILNIKNILAKK